MGYGTARFGGPFLLVDQCGHGVGRDGHGWWNGLRTPLQRAMLST